MAKPDPSLGPGYRRPRYHGIVERLRGEFPRHVGAAGEGGASGDGAGGGQLLPRLAQMLDQWSALGAAGPWLGGVAGPRDAFARREPSPGDRAAAQNAAAPIPERTPLDGRPLDEVLPRLVASLRNLPIWEHPQAQINIAPCPTTASVLAAMLALVANPNLVCADHSGGLAAVERTVSAMVADLVGFDPSAARGLFTFGGAGGMLYGLKIGLEKAAPGTAARGLGERAAIIASEACHGCVQDAAAWLGVGRDNVLVAPTLDDHSASVPEMESLALRAIGQGRRVAALVATIGSTDAFAIDDLAAIAAMRDRLVRDARLDYRPHIHADAVIGWAWSVFNDYDFAQDPLGFGPRTGEALRATRDGVRGADQADTIGVDFHKTGYAPYISSLVLSRRGADFELLAGAAGDAPYLGPSDGERPGRFTLETSRSGAGPLAALASLLLLGKNGYRALLGHATAMSQLLRDRLAGEPGVVTLNARRPGPVTLLRVYPDGVRPEANHAGPSRDAGALGRVEDAERVSAIDRYNRRVFDRLQRRARQGHGAALSLTSVRLAARAEPVVAIKNFVFSPFVEARHMESIVDELRAARQFVAQGS